MAYLTRLQVQQYIDEYDDLSDAVAALVADFPDLEKTHKMYRNRSIIEVLLDDFVSYRS